MIRIRSNSRTHSAINPKFVFPLRLFALIVLLLAALAGTGLCSDVPYHTAHLVAEQKIQHHLSLYGSWNGHPSPTIIHGEPIHHQGQAVAFNFTVDPSGYLLVAVDRVFSPVPLYSARSRFDASRAGHPGALESWIVPELYQRVSALNHYRSSGRALHGTSRTSTADGEKRIQKAWDHFSNSIVSQRATASAGDEEVVIPTVGPLLSTQWGQTEPYNQMAPPVGTKCSRTLTGCVATAWAQVLHYHKWPDIGAGSHWYPWNGTIVSADFDVPYEWDLMPDSRDDISRTPAGDAAVALLMSHAGVAAEMNYGCNSSGSNAWANDVLDTYFKYKAMNFRSRADFEDDEWFALFQTELDADEPRPVIFSIFDETGGHEVVVDGYQTTHLADYVHINYGWDGGEDGFYDISGDFQAGGYIWSGLNQMAITGIEPNRGSRPDVNAGLDRVVYPNALVSLEGVAPQGGADSGYHYQWRQVAIGEPDMPGAPPEVTLSDYDTLNASFRAPEVDADTDLVFMLKVTDTDRSVGFDKVTVTVRPHPPRSSGGGSSSGNGCFIATLQW
jgi:hypothetical protein